MRSVLMIELPCLSKFMFDSGTEHLHTKRCPHKAEVGRKCIRFPPARDKVLYREAFPTKDPGISLYRHSFEVPISRNHEAFPSHPFGDGEMKTKKKKQSRNTQP
jgi:hypothetical protein